MSSGGPKYGHLSTPDPEFLAIKPMLDGFTDKMWNAPGGLSETRKIINTPLEYPDFVPKASDLIITEQKVAVTDGTEIGIKIYKSKETPKDAVLFFVMHGGGWVVGSFGVEEVMCRFAAARNGAVVVSVDYRLAPEFKYPYAVNDCWDVFLWCKKNAKELGVNPERIIVGGASAGANLAAVISLKARDEGLTGILGQILNIPVTCHPSFAPNDKYELCSWEQNKDASLLPAKQMTFFWDQYTPTPVRDAYASPLLAESLEGLPPAHIQVAGLDPLRDEGLAYADALQAAGVPVTVRVYPGVYHGFGSNFILTKARTYQEAVVNWFRHIVQSDSSKL